MVLFVFLVAVIGLLPALIASSKGRNFFLWWLYGALFFIIALPHSLLLKGAGDASSQATNSQPPSALLSDSAASTRSSSKYDEHKWEALKEVDDDIAKAAARVAALSPTLEEELAEKYLALDDKSYLQTLVAKIVAKNEAQKTDAERIMKDADYALSEGYSTEARAYLAAIRNANMIDPDTGERVTAVKKYDGPAEAFAGGFKVVLESGRIILHGIDIHRIFESEDEANGFGQSI